MSDHPGRRVAAAALGIAAAGAGAAVAAQRRGLRHPARSASRTLRAPLPGVERVVDTDDAIGLHVVSGGDEAARLCVVFVHGWTNDARTWHYQWPAMGEEARLVAYDARCHGRSTVGPAGPDVIDRLGRDLALVLDAVAPTGPVALVAHSMGGMTVLALADRAPEFFGDRVVAVALLSTSAGRLAEVTFGLPAAASAVTKWLVPRALPGLGRRAHLVDRGRAAVPTGVVQLLQHRFAFRSAVPPEVEDLLGAMIEATPFSVIADFFPAFASHDKLAALDVLRKVEALVLVGDGDRMTPVDHSRAIASELPGAELVVVPQAGHMVMLEHPDLVNERLRQWLERVAG